MRLPADTPYLYQEIFAQPQVLTTLLLEESERAKAIVQAARDRDIRMIVMAARGSSDNAALYGKYLFGAMVGLPVAMATPSLFTLYQRPPRLAGTLVVGISQSGQSTDIVTVVETAAQQGAMTLAITNDPDSPLAQVAEFVLPLHAGEERSIAATKTYTAQLMALALLATHWAENKTAWRELTAVPAAVSQALSLADNVARMTERYRYMNTCVVIGRGYNYATAYEIALKLKELTYVVAEPYSSADFQHGPIAVIGDGFPVLLIAPQGRVHPEIQRLAERLRERGAELLAISDVPETLALARTPLPLPAQLPEWLTPFTAVVLGQLFAYHLTLTKDYDPDHPRGLTKVTQTR
ncbi:MAG: SIS domain-containing protein [Chloroflexi bacterium]|nr:SIS domain-containing protein [Chloroflexota bacterium]